MPNLTNAQVAKIDKCIRDEMARERIPGLSIGVLSKGRTLFSRGYGLANVELNVPVTPDMIFDVCSITKQFVSAGIMMLVEKGKLNLEDSIARYFAGAPRSWKQIKLKNLLSHTSGLQDYTGSRYSSSGALFDIRLDFTEAELVKRAFQMPLNFKAGDRYAYCNTNYMLLGVMIHKVSGKFWYDYLKERIFGPLGMNSIRLIKQKDVVPNKATGYLVKRRSIQNVDWESDTFGSLADGNLYSNVLDFAKWDDSLYGDKLLRRSSLDAVLTIFKLNDGRPNRGNYGFGWEVNEVNKHRVVEHTGGNDGFCDNFSRYVDDRLAIAVFCTKGDAIRQSAEIITHEVAGFINPELVPPKTGSSSWQKHTAGHYVEKSFM